MRGRGSAGHGHKGERRRPPGGRVRSIVQPRVLFLLVQKAAYGYELMEELNKAEGAAIDPALLYRTLHRFQADGLVSSTWDTDAPGAARRVYEITAEGLEYLHAWVVELVRTRERLDRFLHEYEVYFREERR
ncbi:MAG: PadR family transcriptional regulator [Anaerolineaceae bacterium]|nr:helix-turn-helix transcriptional regulator [Anaerolineae bacterium]MDX9830141.1 helix-turn-helix transcriptional regulator [Anaerolineae bacterium]NLF14846.1 PadR family transcriptional regulator [Anaerolineaceae bacterium]